MALNLFLLPALLLAAALFAGGYWLAGRSRRPAVIGVLLGVGAVLSVPGLLIALYYLHLYDRWLFLYQFRAIPGSELTAAGCGFMGGLLARYGPSSKMVSTSGLAVLTAIGIVLPHAKPLILAPKLDQIQDSWSGDVCLQSMPYTCGPASMATILRFYGINATEQELARECYTYRGGTECWYMARAFRRRGLQVVFEVRRPEEFAPSGACIAGVLVGGTGHFVALLPTGDDDQTVVDPMYGLEKPRATEHTFTGFYMLVSQSQ